MQQSSAIPKVGVESLDWSIAPKVRGHTSPGQRPGFCQQRTQGLKARSILVASREWFKLSALQILLFPRPRPLAWAGIAPHLRC
jgi:hypothetical protein